VVSWIYTGSAKPIREGLLWGLEVALVPTTTAPTTTTTTGPNGEVGCGNLGGSLHTSLFDVNARGLGCSGAKRIIQSWLDADCGAKQAGTACGVAEGFTCILRPTSYEGSGITCSSDGREVRFGTGG
jgi:hypothetical protein